ncbi:ABC transporter permease [Chitinophaga caseinilytica]|uniref:ABC transporter permease n=1 Tax=Chitinophaga caseinilytica TaxID=2267521 RepID=A0ABZ2Z246_9BACT
MVRNFLKIAGRHMLNSKGFSFINIAGLAIGMASAILILLWIQDERSYDNFHEKKDRIYEVWNRVASEGKLSSWSGVSALTGPVLENDLPEVEKAVRVKANGSLLFTVGEKKVNQSGLLVDEGFLQMFTFPMLTGNLATALRDKHSVVLTEKSAKTFFGDGNALGKLVKIDNGELFTVTGIVKDPPRNSYFSFDYLVPWAAQENPNGSEFGWNDNGTNTFLLLKENADFAVMSGKLKDLKQRYDGEAKTLKWEFFAYPMARWRMYSSFTNGVEDGGGRIALIRLFAVIAGFILLIACINFMNMTTARSEKRAKEVGIRKVSGARKSALVFQFVGESVCTALLAGIMAVVIVMGCMPAFNQLTEKDLFLDFTNVYTWLALGGFVLFTGLLAGSYPAFFLSAYKPLSVLKGTFKRSNALVTPRKVLVIFQFTIAIFLIICTIIVKRQINHVQAREVGYERDHLIYHFLTDDISRNYALIKNELIQSGVATSVAKTNAPLTERWSGGWGQNWQGKDPNDNTSFDRYATDEGLGVTAGLQFIEGRDFDLQKFPTDSLGLIINEAALKVMHFKQPIGQIVSDLGTDWHVIGVIKDVVLKNPYESARPILICGAKSSFLGLNVMQIKLNDKNDVAVNLQKAETIFHKYNPEFPFEYKFVDEEYARKFDSVQRLGTLSALFAGLTIFISCLGLLGLAMYMAETRIREIGIRKVLGASVLNITVLLSRDFVALVAIAFVLAAPLAYWGVSQWLMDFSYRVSVGWQSFALAGCVSVLIALLTVSFQSVKAALANPVRNLKVE